jgi:hypothetical protein
MKKPITKTDLLALAERVEEIGRICKLQNDFDENVLSNFESELKTISSVMDISLAKLTEKLEPLQSSVNHFERELDWTLKTRNLIRSKAKQLANKVVFVDFKTGRKVAV